MSAVVKIFLFLLAAGAIALAALLGLSGYVVAAAARSTPDQVTEAAAEIASFSLPEGYESDYSFSAFGFSIASFDRNDGHSHLTLVQGPKGLGITQGALERMLNQARPGQSDRTTRLSVVDTATVTVRGAETTAVVQAGVSGNGTAYRQVTASFEGKGGPALVVLEEPVTRWDDTRAMDLLASIE